jgi:hypothetical protein
MSSGDPYTGAAQLPFDEETGRFDPVETVAQQRNYGIMDNSLMPLHHDAFYLSYAGEMPGSTRRRDAAA